MEDLALIDKIRWEADNNMDYIYTYKRSNVTMDKRWKFLEKAT